jgi:hypothetical protein
MATAGSGDFSPTVARGGGEEWGCGGVQEEEGSVLIASKASGGSWRAGSGWRRRVHDGRRTGAGGGVVGGRRQGEWAGLGCGGFAPGEV